MNTGYCYVVVRAEFFDFENVERPRILRVFESYDEAKIFVETSAKTEGSADFEWTNEENYVFAEWGDDGGRFGIRYELHRVPLN